MSWVDKANPAYGPFTRTLDEYAVPYEAEEYRGGWDDRRWGIEGRVYTEMLPFFRTKLLFD